MDFKKEFDLVDLNSIIKGLVNLDVHPAIIPWIKTFCSNHEQCAGGKFCIAFAKKKANGGLPQSTKLVRYYLLLSLVPNSMTGIEGSKLLMIFYALEYYRDTLQV